MRRQHYHGRRVGANRPRCAALGAVGSALHGRWNDIPDKRAYDLAPSRIVVLRRTFCGRPHGHGGDGCLHGSDCSAGTYRAEIRREEPLPSELLHGWRHAHRRYDRVMDVSLA